MQYLELVKRMDRKQELDSKDSLINALYAEVFVEYGYNCDNI